MRNPRHNVMVSKNFTYNVIPSVAEGYAFSMNTTTRPNSMSLGYARDDMEILE